MKSITRRAIALILGFTLLFSGTVLFSGCADKGETIAELDGHTLSESYYCFMLSRIKATLSRAGYSVESADFWNTIVTADNTTYDQYFRQAALTDARRYLAAMVLFDEYDLTLPDSEYDRIDKELDEAVREAGSKSELNAALSSFGVNYNMLRDFYIMEAKFAYIRDHIYGQNGSKVAAQVRQEYLEENAVAFRQVLIRAFDYVYETDKNGDIIYFVPEDNNAKVNNIAYDKENGKNRTDEFGNVIKDENGETVYFTESGRIAYDKENGVRAHIRDEEGFYKTEKYSAAQLAENKATAEEIIASVEKGDYAAFEALLAEFELDTYGPYELAENYDETYDFVYTNDDTDEVVTTLAEMEAGELRMFTSEYGYNVIMKYPIPSDAATNSAYSEQLSDLTTRVVAELFHNMCKPHMDKVVVDEDIFAGLPSMTEIGTNFYY